MSKKFALIGVGGYIAPRHLRAIKETGNELVAALDPNDSVGIIDSYFPNAHFFTEFERFDRHLEKLRHSGEHIDYVSICSPNYLHDAHVRFALRIGANVICEKPLVINYRNLEALDGLEKETKLKINTILQLRLHPIIMTFKKYIDDNMYNCGKFTATIDYIVPRGKWYDYSWKGNMDKSGGIVTNIGIHLFDIALWLFGKVKNNTIKKLEKRKANGILELEKATVTWNLSLDGEDIPHGYDKNVSYRDFTINEPLYNNRQSRTIQIFGDLGKSYISDLHIESYKKILNGDGFGINDIKDSIKLVSDIRNRLTN